MKQQEHITSSNWLVTLTDKQRDRVHAVMRQISDEMQVLHQASARLTPNWPSVPVGAAHKDPFLKASAAEHFLRALRFGSTPEQASSKAQYESTLDVRIHNQARQHDTCWQRWEQCQQAYIEGLRRRIEGVAQ